MFRYAISSLSVIVTAMADDVVMCWAPECAELLPPSKSGRPRRYHSPACKMRAMRRNGGTAPDTPYPPFAAPPAPKLDTVESRGVTVKARRQAKPTGRRTNPPRGAAVSPEAAAPLPESPGAGGSRPSAVGAGPAVGPTPPAPGYPESSAEDLDPRAPTVPVQIKPHPMVEAYRADLEKLGALQSREGQKVLEMAGKLVSSAASPAASANLSKELDRLMAELEAKAQPQGETDAFNVIRERTLRKLGVVGVQVKLP